VVQSPEERRKLKKGGRTNPPGPSDLDNEITHHNKRNGIRQGLITSGDPQRGKKKKKKHKDRQKFCCEGGVGGGGWWGTDIPLLKKYLQPSGKKKLQKKTTTPEK